MPTADIADTRTGSREYTRVRACHRPLASSGPSGSRTPGLAQHVKALAVLIGIDLAAREPFGEHLLSRGRRGRGREALAAFAVQVADSGGNRQDQHGPEQDHADDSQRIPPSAHVVAVRVHHRDLLRMSLGRSPPWPAFAGAGARLE